jgi:hypothetical protein
MNKKLLIGMVIAGSVLATGTAFAKTSLGTVTTPSGLEVPKVSIQGIVESLSTSGKNQVQVKESDGSSYNVNLGPRWYADTAVEVGDNITVEGTEKNEGTIGAWSLTKQDGTQVTIRTEAGKPGWAGERAGSQQKGVGNGTGDCQNQ